MVISDFNTIYENLKKYMIVNQDKITDFNEGSVIATIFESVARVLEKFYIDTRIGYSNNLKQIPYSVFDFKKKEGSKAVGEVYFTSSEILYNDTIIPIGTKVASGNYIFTTTSLCKIAKGEVQSNTVGVLAEKVGKGYNVPELTINEIISILPSNVVNVVNTKPTSGGNDEESNTKLEIRFKNYINGLQGTNEYGLKSSILKIDGVRDVNLIKHIPPVDSFNFTVYIDDGTGGLEDSVKQEVELLLKGNDSVEYPGLLVPGLNARVAAAQPIYIDIELIATIYKADETMAKFEIEENLRNEINSMSIGKNVILTNLIIALRRLNYITDIPFISINGESANLEILENQVARFKSVNITFEKE